MNPLAIDQSRAIRAAPSRNTDAPNTVALRRAPECLAVEQVKTIGQFGSGLPCVSQRRGLARDSPGRQMVHDRPPIIGQRPIHRPESVAQVGGAARDVRSEAAPMEATRSVWPNLAEESADVRATQPRRTRSRILRPADVRVNGWS